MNKRKEQRINKMGATHKRGVELKAAKTGRNRTEEGSKLSEHLFRSLIENAQDAIVILNPDITIRYESPSMARMTGRKAEDRVGKNPFEYCHPDDSKKVTEEFLPLLENKIPIVRMELRLQHENGTFLDVELIGTNLIDDPVVGGIVLNLRDISEHKRAEEELKQQKHVLDERLKELGCLYGISELIKKKNISLEEMFQGVVDLIPAGWQHSEITCARIVLDGQEFRTENFRETIWKQTQDITVYGNRIAAVEVFYLEERPEIDEGPFLKEERLLIDEIAKNLGEAIEYKRIEELLQRSEKQFLTLVETMNDGMTIQGTDGVMTFVNDKLCQMLGYASDELIGHTVMEILDEVNRGKYKEQIEKRREGVIDPYEIEGTRKDGSRIATRVSPQLITDAEGNIVGSFGIITDVTERKQAEEALRESEERFRSLVENAPYMIIIADREGKILFMNYTVAGFNVEDTIGTSLYNYISVEYHNEVRRSIKGVFESGEPAAYEIVGAGPDGTTSFYYTCVGAITHDGHVIAMTHIIVDITERKRVEEALRESEEKLRYIFESISDGVTVIDLEGKILDMNEAQLRQFGFSNKEEGIGQNCFDFVSAKDHTRTIEDAMKAIELGYGPPQEYTFVNKDGREYDGEASASLLRDSFGNPVGFVGVVRDVTERRQAEEALRESEEKYRLLIESSDAAITFFDENGTYLFMNSVAAGWRNDLPKDYVGKTLHDRFPKDLADMFVERFRRIIKSGVGETIEELVEPLNRYISSNLQPVRNQEGKVIGVQIVTYDVTEHKRAEQELRESEEKYRLLIESSDAAITYFSENGTHLFLNSVAAGWLNVKPEDLIGKTVHDVFPKDVADVFVERFRRIIKSGVGETIEELVEPLDRYISSNLQPVRNQKGKIIGIQIVTYDITERKWAEEELLESKEKLSRVFDAIEYAVIISDMEGKITDENEAALGFQGYSCKEEVIGRWGFEFISEKDRLRAIQEGMAAIERGYGSVEAVFVTKDGKEYDAKTTANVLHDASGNAVGFVSVTRDVTERKKAESELRRYSERLRAMAARLSAAEEEERRRLAQELHDQVGQYLTALSINLSRASTELPKEAADLVLPIMVDSQSIVEQMSDIIRNIMANLRPPVIEDYGLVAAIRWYTDRFSGRTGIDVTVEGEEPSPRLRSSHESALYRIVQEVFTNIAKHAQATRVSVNMAVEGEKVRLLITDDGIGFDYKEVDMSDEKQGWGLVIMSERAISMGGSFKIESRPGHGTRVIVEVEK